MGLAEKRIQEEFASKRIPEALKSYAESTKGAIADLKVEIDWASFGTDKNAYENLSTIWEQPLQGVEAVCADATGQGAVKETLKKVVIRNVTNPKEVRAEMKDGVLFAFLDAAQGTNGTPGWTEFQKVLENAL